MAFWHGIPFGVDFRGGTLVHVTFADTPNDQQIRSSLDKAGLHNARIQHLSAEGGAPANEVVIALDEKDVNENDLSAGKNKIINALEVNPPQGQQDLNN